VTETSLKKLLYVSSAGNFVASFEAWLRKQAAADQVARQIGRAARGT